ncbi:P-loop containing nucleoside triphosphate hydrolase protein [Polychytrium aggregatum]|uniref:P-loop containing nucleoside triphosphate hydrolase protein n=1 Tax=Polychytrium aggregatum TaxID=110093 RepID=UPI0022FF066A|nr:P-loop containing nucleoside triphosphate hydrolase protein [Polychytrium aggregatum]KAI9197380.1 P-loop containing nucleoside triphosphate hydrolase protein [Polychytrium aggregatum]
MDNTLADGFKSPFKITNAFELLPFDRAESVSQRYKGQYKSRYTHLGYRLIAMELHPFLMQLGLTLLTAVLSFGAPFCTYHIMNYIQTPDGRPITFGLAFVVILFFVTIMETILDNQAFYIGGRMIHRIRAVLITQIFEKSLKKTQAPIKNLESGEDETNGKIVSLMSLDAEKIANSSNYLVYIFTTPLQIIFAIAALISFLGWSALAGVGVMILSMPLTSFVTTSLNTYYDKMLAMSDKRNTRTQEALQAIRIIKFFAWEPQFLNRITEARNLELQEWIRYFTYNGLSIILWGLVPTLVTIFTFFTYTVVFGHDLDVTTAFTCLALFNTLKFPLTAFPEMISEAIQLNVSVNRINRYLNEPELEKYSDSVTEQSVISQGESISAIGFSDAWFEWHHSPTPETTASNPSKWRNLFRKKTPETTPLLDGASTSGSSSSESPKASFTLRDINITFPDGKLSTICGSTGSGKSSIIRALLGEMSVLQGSNRMIDPRFKTGPRSGVAFVAQTAWLANATIRDNILFGEPYDAARYARVIEACALTKDLKGFEAGDLTEIGEKGINLSGGQKQRVSLARAAYSRAHYILLDDPLSAVDAPTARHLFHKCIVGLLKHRTRILVTHATSVALPSTDFLVVVNQGRIFAHGAVREVMNVSGVDTIIAAEEARLSLEQPETHSEELDADATDATTDFANGKTPEEAKKLIENEGSDTGSVKAKIYWFYLQATGGLALALIFVAGLFAQNGVRFLVDYWLKIWAEAYAAVEAQPLTPFFINTSAFNALADVDIGYYLAIYVALNIFLVVVTTGMYAFRCFGAYGAAKKLHEMLIERVMYAPVRWFDVTPLGRISNRLSKDVASVDTEVMGGCVWFLTQVTSTLSIIAIVGWITPLFLVIVFPIGYVYIKIAQYYLASSREMKRLQSVSRSPIFSSFSECLVGVSTIRAYGHEQRFIQDNMEKVDKNHRVHKMMWSSNRWLSVRIVLITGLVILFAGCSILLSRDIIGAGFAGLSLTWVTVIAENLLWLVRMHAQMEMGMNSVERVHEYMQIDNEPPMEIPETRPAENWPTHGRIVFENVEVRYAPDLEPVLRGISYEFKGRRKIGIVGRTGAGKSTLTLALFRIMELAQGTITIDGVDISKIGLRDLRRKLTIIPQEPVLFNGDIRSNLDPFNEHPDDELWDVLIRVRFLQTLQKKLETDSGAASLASSDSTLDLPQVEDSKQQQRNERNELNNRESAEKAGFSLASSVSEGGSNFSQGQRQLLCLARALLKRSAVTILDEATASVDNDTDAFIQETIRGPEFSRSTVLCIAHRVRTIADYDQILVLSHGEVAETGTPLELMHKEGGIFNKMCQDSGEFDELVKLASKPKPNHHHA